MPKNGWSYLPVEILRIVFHCLEDSVMVSMSPIKYLGVPSPSLLQCQLACKNWSSLAQSEFYKCILLKKSKQLDLLIDSNRYTKDLVYYIMFNESTFGTSQSIVIISFRKIAFFFTQLKRVYSSFIYEDEIWRVVKSEWSRGRFSKLQVIPFKSSPRYEDVVQYNDMAWGLRNNLRELEVYDDNSVPTQIMEKLSHFPGVGVVYFKFRGFNNVYTIDQQLKKSRSVRFLNVTFFETASNTYHTPVIPTKTNALPLVQQLYIRKFLYDCNIYSYVMQVFPNLNKFSLTTKDILDARTVPSLPTNVAIQFLKYLLRIPFLRVGYIPFENLEQVLMEFYDQKRIIKNLDIQYVQSNRTINRSSYMSVWAHESHKIHIEVNYAKEISRFILSRIGMIEHNGGNLQYIKMDMGFDINALELWTNNNSSQDNNLLSDILSKCSNLKKIHISHTILCTFGTGLKEQKMSFIQEIELINVLLHTSFLSDMSFYLPFISRFEINHCRFNSETEDNVTINMPDTAFTHIAYTSSIDINKVYLELSTKENDITRWFASSKGGYDLCIEKEYQNSLQDKKSLSFSIQCKQVDSINFSIFGFNLFIKTILRNK